MEKKEAALVTHNTKTQLAEEAGAQLALDVMLPTP